MLEVEGLSKAIDGAALLRDISFTLEKGTITGLVGRNGVGKTTLLRTLVGILLPDAGDVRYERQSIYTQPQVKTNLFFVPDSKPLFPSYSPQQLARLYKRIYPRFDEAYLWAGMTRFNLPASRKLRHYSKGMKALFSLVLAFATRAEGILLDEPTDGLDVIIKRQWLQLMVEEVAEQRHLVLLSSHRLNELESICDRVLMMKEGAIAENTDMTAAKRRYKKLQVVHESELPLALVSMPGIHLLSRTGRITTLLLEGETDVLTAQIRQTQPLLIDELPLSLEDLFVAKLGGETVVR